jgi:hypothetical protein
MPMRMAAHGTNGLALMLLNLDISGFRNMLTRMVVHGMNGLAPKRPNMAIWIY